MKHTSINILSSLLFCSLFLLFVLSCSSPRSMAKEESLDLMKEEAVEDESGYFDDTKNKEAGKDEEGPDIEAARKLATTDELRKRAPELLVRISPPDMEPLPCKSHDIYVIIVGHRARIVQDMVFENNTSQILSGTIMIELPDGASPSYLGMFQGKGMEKDTQKLPDSWLNPQIPPVETLLSKELALDSIWQTRTTPLEWGELRSAKVVNPIQGRQVYESITRRQVDPALAEWAGSGKFSTRIFPIPAMGYKRIVFAYDRPLTGKGENLIYPLPLPKEIKAETRITLYSLSDNFINPELLAGEKSLKTDTVNEGLQWEFIPEKNFSGSLIFHTSLKNPKVQVLTGLHPQVDGKLIHFRYTPEIQTKGNLRNTGAAVFVLDTSYSTKEKLFSVSGKMLKSILEQDKSITEFAVIAFDVSTRKVTDGFWKNTKNNQDKLFSIIEEIWLQGATNFSSVLQTLTEDPLLVYADTIFLLSDGQITWGAYNPLEMKKEFTGILSKPWICYTFGDAPVNRSLFSVLSHDAGQMIHVGIGQDIAVAARAHLKEAVSLDQVFTRNQDEIIVAGDPKWIYPGQTLEIATRTSLQSGNIEVSLVIDGKKEQITLPLEVNPLISGIAARSWADLYVNHLLGIYDKTANQVVLALSQAFSLTNREASFIILETDEEYVEHRIEPEKLNSRTLMEIAQQRAQFQPYGAPDIEILSEESYSLISALSNLPEITVWKIPQIPEIINNLEIIREKPQGSPEKDTPAELYKWARSFLHKNAGQNDEENDRALSRALRVLSTIVELKPRDDAACRLVGYVLMEWGMYKQACELFTLIRQRRPFEPQNYLLEGMALAALGKAKEAAIRYEIVLTESYPRFDSFVKPVATRLYFDLLKAIINKQGQNTAGELAEKRLNEIEDVTLKKGRLMLFWNLDDTDVDLHVVESNNVEVYYSNPKSFTGGYLFWDNTTGLGPELYEHPTLSKKGFEVYVNYFGSSSVEGAAPSATLVCAFTKSPNYKMHVVNWYSTVLIGVEEGKVIIMPRWMP